MPDIRPERLRQIADDYCESVGAYTAAASIRAAADEIKRLQEEAETWKENCAAERQAHEATLKWVDELDRE